MNRFSVISAALSVSILSGCASSGSTRPATSSTIAPSASSAIADKTKGLTRRDGFIPLYLDDKQGKLLLELPRDTMKVLMFYGLATGLGSNPIGLDRGANGDNFITRFEKNGERVLVVFENWNYRTSSGNADHARTIAESFPPSTAGSMPVVAQEGGRILVDATDFVMRDWNDVIGTLQQSNEGSYSVARDRSSIYREYTRAFPENTEIDVALTFTTQGRPGNTVAMIVPDGKSFTLRQHISFLPLPDPGYRPRVLDPRMGFFGIRFNDYAQPIQNPLEVRWIARHRLERVDQANPNSPIKEPLVYYIDRGIPEPIRTATFEGAKWWEDAFNQAGLRGAFRVELLPEGVDPLDARYNVIQWENRHERGWSIGGSLGDPRTGEILKAMARMDSHRARTDYNLYAGLMGAEAAAADTAFVLGRIRQVTAHEIGHTLGIAHNYIASTYERGSVMDYPPPRVRLTSAGEIDISAAYDAGPGEYDILVLRWGYGIFPPATEQDSLRAIVAEGLRKGLLFLSDADARPDFASDPRTNLWDDAANATEFLNHQMAVRRVAMSRFGLRNVRVGEPVALLQERFAPVYLMHRFAINSLAKTIGGMEYSNAVRGDGQQATRPIPASEQRAALDALVRTLAPPELAIPDTVISLLGPRPFSYNPWVELFGSRTRPVFDEFGAARTLAQMVVDAVLQRERAARLVQFSTRGENPLTLSEAIDRLAASWSSPGSETRKNAALRRVVQRALADRLITLAADREASTEVRSLVELKMTTLRNRARTLAGSGSDIERAHWTSIAGDFTRWLERQELPTPTAPLRAPPGDPFGND